MMRKYDVFFSAGQGTSTALVLRFIHYEKHDTEAEFLADVERVAKQLGVEYAFREACDD